MASLESLKDPLQRLGILGTAGSQSSSFRRNEVNNADVWDVTKQYYLNDVVFSGIDGGAYVMEGGTTALGAAPKTALLGGVDPAQDWIQNVPNNWVPLAPTGPRVVKPAGTQSATVVAGPAAAWTFVNCVLNATAVGANVPVAAADYMAQIQFTLTKTVGGALAATDWNTITFTPDGGGTARSITVIPNADTTATAFSWAGQVYLGPTPTTTTVTVTGVTGANAGATAQYVISNLQVVYVPVIP
jgi:hypothetical protein